MLLQDPAHTTTPFPFFTTDAALPAADAWALHALFDKPRDWQEHRTFYRAQLCDVTSEVPQALRTALVARMRAVTGLDLLPPVAVTIQTMEPGQGADVHTDRPLVGYEAVRLVLQLNPTWAPAHGGLLRMHHTKDAPPEAAFLTRPPRFNSAFGFAMTPRSFHAVDDTAHHRRTAVFNFWHAGNPPGLDDRVRRAMAGFSIAALPRALDAEASAAEAVYPDDVTLRAAMVAYLLTTWGYSDAVCAAGYRACLPGAPEVDAAAARRAAADPEAAAVLHARWVARLYDADYSITAYQTWAPALATLSARL